MGTLVWIDRFLFLGVLVAAFSCFRWYYIAKVEKGFKGKKTREIDYEIFYQGNRIDSGYFELEKGQRFRFGFSDRREFHNDFSLNKYFGKMEEYENVDELEEKYMTWFELKWTEEGIKVRPVYKREHRGNKYVYLKSGRAITSEEGEIFEGDMTILARKQNKDSLMVRVFDYNEV